MKPKVGIYHKTLRLDGLAKTGSELDISNEKVLIHRLNAAVTLSPDEIRSATPSALEEAIKDVLPALPGRSFPAQTISELVRRRAVAGSGTGKAWPPREFVAVVWPFQGQTAVDFDPLSPTLSAECSDMTLGDKVELAGKLVIKDFMAAHMTKKEAGVQQLVELRAALQAKLGLAHSQAGMPTGEEWQIWAGVMQLATAVVAMVQSEPLTSATLATFEKLDGGSLKEAGALESIMADPWWASRRSKVWETAAYETAAEPLMRSIASVMTDASCPFGAPLVEEKWQLARARLQGWVKQLRSGAADFVLEALVHRVRSDAAVAASQPHTSETLDWVAKLRERAAWLGDFVLPQPIIKSQLADADQELGRVAADIGTKVRLSSGNALLEEVCAQDTVTEEGARRLSAEYDGCEGLPVPQEVLTQMGALLEQVRGQEELTPSHCKLAVLLWRFLAHSRDASAAPGPDDSAAFAKTLSGLRLQEALGSSAGDTKAVRVARITEALLDFERCGVTGVLPSAEDAISAAAAAAKAELAKEHAGRLQSACAKAEEAVESLAAAAGGGRSPGESWKAALGEASTADDVAREATYFLFAGGTAVTRQLDDLYIRVTEAWALVQSATADLQTVGGSPLDLQALADKKAAAERQSKITGMEANLVEAWGIAGAEKRAKKIKAHITAMARHGLAPDDIHPRIWQKSQDLVAGSRAGAAPCT